LNHWFKPNYEESGSIRKIQERLESQKRERIEQMSVNGVGSIYTDQTSQQTTANSSTFSKELGKSEFLELLVTQLQNQDPMNPMDNQAFITQLATFSSLEQLMSINQGVTKLAGASSEAAASENGSENSV
jgi:flagellar hook assembly protein FlgD